VRRRYITLHELALSGFHKLISAPSGPVELSDPSSGALENLDPVGAAGTRLRLPA